MTAVGPGDFLLNVSVDVSSVALIELCRELGALYLDTCIEPWPGGYTDPTVPAARRTNYALREEALALRPGIKILYTSGYTHNAIIQQAVFKPGVTLFEKPFTPDALVRKVREVLDAPA